MTDLEYIQALERYVNDYKNACDAKNWKNRYEAERNFQALFFARNYSGIESCYKQELQYYTHVK